MDRRAGEERVRARCRLIVLILEKLVPLSFTFLFACKWSTTHVCCFLCLCFFEPVGAVRVCLTYSPRLFWSRMNGPRKLQTFIETLAVHLGSFRITVLAPLTWMKEPRWEPQGAVFHLSGGLGESQALIHLLLVINDNQALFMVILLVWHH